MVNNISETISDLNISLNPLDLEFWSNLPPGLYSKVGSLITILKITGIVIIAYILFMIIRWLLSYKRNRRINKMYHKINEIDRKVDVLLAKSRLAEIQRKIKVGEKPALRKKGLLHRLFSKKKKKKKKK